MRVIKPDSRMCTAKRSNGEICKQAPIKGGFVCMTHGGASPQVRAKAQLRLQEMVEPALVQLNRILTRAVDSKSPDDTKLNAIKEILNRVGVSGISKLEISGPEGAPLEVSIGVSKEEKIRRITGLLDRVSDDEDE